MTTSLDGSIVSADNPQTLVRSQNIAPSDSSVPFPSSEDLKIRDVNSPTKLSPESRTTTSSKLTSSDKLSALPAPSTTPNRAIRSPNRVFRRSLDATSSLPSFPSGLDLVPASPPLPSWQGSSVSTFPRASTSDGSVGRETPRQRVSFDSDRVSLPSLINVRQAFSRNNRGSDPPAASPAVRSSAAAEHKDSPMIDSSNLLSSPSPSQSRAASPLRIFQQWSANHLHRAHSREEPFIPIDPFRFTSQYFHLSCFASTRVANTPDDESEQQDCNNVPTCCLPLPISCPESSPTSFSVQNLALFLTDTLPRLIYLHLLLRLPSLYFSRVARIFEDAEVSRPDIQRMIEACNGGTANAPTSRPILTPVGNVGTASMQPPPRLPFPEDWNPPVVSPALVRFKYSWEAFIDSLMREWKTLNVVSALLLSAILTIFQIPSAASDPLTRTSALLSLICALMSLSYGCIYIVRFGTMRSMYKASRWAEEARKTNTLIWWNVWVLLAMPAVWMAWSMLLFVISILSFVWRTGSVLDPDQRAPLPPNAALGTRVAITGVFGLGMMYFALIIQTLKRYGSYSERGLGFGMSVNVELPTRTVERERELDAALERRGRNRERNQTRVRRREERVEMREIAEGDSKFKTEQSGLKTMLGLGLTGTVPGEHEQGVHHTDDVSPEKRLVETKESNHNDGL